MSFKEFNAEKAILSAFDSVNLLNTLKEKRNKTQEDLDAIERNKKHLELMLEKDEFHNAITREQLEAIAVSIL